MSKRRDIKRRNSNYEKPRMCDPGMCEHCDYLGDGNAVCTRFNNAVVLSDWEPTDNTLMCRRQRRERTVR